MEIAVKSCGCIVLDDNKVLIVKQRKGHWGFPKGRMEKNETEKETALREVKEETNLDVEIIGEKSYKDQYITKKGMKEVVYFIAKKIGGELKPQIKEIQEIKWVNYPYALKYITYKTTKEIFKKFLEEEIEFY